MTQARWHRRALLSLALLLSACGGGGRTDAEGRTQPSGGAEYRLDLPYRRAVALPAEALELTLTEVRDARCRAEVQCIQAGDAEVDVEVALPGLVVERKTLTLPLRAGAGGSASATLRDWRFTLLALNPSPPTGRTQASDYQAQLRVERRVP